MSQCFIFALQERWRPETHTFHLPIGECTVTLEDVYMLLGLPIDGKAVNGSVQHANSMCERVLGRDLVVPTQGSRGQGISLVSLRAYYDELVFMDNSTEEHVWLMTKVYIMLMFGKLLFPESTVWGWWRMPTLSPAGRNNYTFPYATRFCGPKLDYSKNPRGSVVLYRDLIDHLRAEDFNWRPYLLLDHEPNESDREVWTAVVPIIRFNIVEMHQSDRVRLQFGMHQPIPDPPTDLGRWHIKRVNNQWDHADYRTFAPEFCEMWKQRRSRGVYRLKHHLAKTRNNVKSCLAIPDDIKKTMLDKVYKLQKNLLQKSQDINIEGDNVVANDDLEVADCLGGKRKSQWFEEEEVRLTECVKEEDNVERLIARDSRELHLRLVRSTRHFPEDRLILLY
ncbi:serine/threonine-protein phosphatase 7 long form homolog [Vicia villosa]|uniref:serine/threonine-protein phosphatase 7 long form homolog n=1 Tax=Vicia villosa TaxID=3911 RepID=UPI00273C2B19|nr:serine/threonine-protein phosphatase 7 long form homolog [Vicia villosa]